MVGVRAPLRSVASRLNGVSLVALVLAASLVQAAPPEFDKHVAPLLASHCLDCHSGPKPKGGLDLSHKAKAFAKKTIVAGKPDESPLWQRVADGEMPPKKPLPEAERKILKEWIAAGAVWGADPIDPFRFTSSTRAGYDWWALQPLAKPAVPANGGATAIDRFVIQKLETAKLTPSGPADKRTLIRRLTYDLTGLPPTPAEVEAFIKDESPAAYEKVVDRLLASPHYGERQARHWMDVVRFGESDGFERNMGRKTAWPYRDWLIRAFNSDLPYDQFAKLQLAGDVLDPAGAEAVRATGFLVAGVHNTVLGSDEMRAIAKQDELEDLVGATGQTFLGLTVNCARCHDHKFDPISQKDFYRFTSALSGVAHGERPLPDAGRDRQLATATKAVAETRKLLDTLESPARQAILGKAAAEPVVPPVAAWDFRKGPKDLVGALHAEAKGAVKLTEAGAVFDGNSYLRTPPLPFPLRAKTLEAWVTLDRLKQYGGGVMTVATPDGVTFDAIVYGEKEPNHWMAGSNGFVRTESFHGTPEETVARTHVAITYAADGTITGYRDGKPYGKPYVSKNRAEFAADKAVVLFGLRHEPAGGNRLLAGTVAAARLYDKALTAEEVAASYRLTGQVVSDAAIDAKLSDPDRAKRKELRDTLASRVRDMDALQKLTAEKAYLATTTPPGVTRLLLRGDVTTPADVVAAGGITAVTSPAPDFKLAPDAPDADRRRKLAEWVASPDNPLFARVMANRVWHWRFGTGIVETPNDFGFNGGRPSHPELLNWLAADFRDGGFSVKKLTKTIVMSSTYRQASAIREDAREKDADNRLLWRKKPARLDAESLRDTLLAVAGLLNAEVGGPSFSDYKETFLNGTTYFEPFDPAGPEFHRRSVYRFRPRGANVGLLDAFDCPDPASAAPRRAMTTTPLQALSLWNNGFVLRMAEATAKRIEGVGGTPAEKVRRLWLLTLQREPTVEEMKLAAPLAEKHGLKALARAVFNGNELMTAE